VAEVSEEGASPAAAAASAGVARPEDGKRAWRFFEHFEPLRFAFGITLCY